MVDLLIICGIALIIACISALLLRQKGYPFWRTFVSSFIGIAALLALAYKLIRPYL